MKPSEVLIRRIELHVATIDALLEGYRDSWKELEIDKSAEGSLRGPILSGTLRRRRFDGPIGLACAKHRDRKREATALLGWAKRTLPDVWIRGEIQAMRIGKLVYYCDGFIVGIAPRCAGIITPGGSRFQVFVHLSGEWREMHAKPRNYGKCERNGEGRRKHYFDYDSAALTN